MNRLLLPLFTLVLTAHAAQAGQATPAAVPSDLQFLAVELGALQNSPSVYPVLALDRSLVEREQERIQADCATPEDSPSTVPFSLSRPEDFVLNDSPSRPAFDPLGDTMPVVREARLAHAQEPATWALFGLGGAVLLLSRPIRSEKPVSNKKNK